MRKINRIIAVGCCFVCLLSVSSCGKKEKEIESQPTTSISDASGDASGNAKEKESIELEFSDTITTSKDNKYKYTNGNDGTICLVEFDWEKEKEDPYVIPSEIDGHTVSKITAEFAENIYAETVQIPETVKYIDDNAFYNHWMIKEIIGGTGVKEIGDNAFASCRSCTKIEVPNVEKIGRCAFAGCESLETMEVTYATDIGEFAFSGCGFTNISLSESLFMIRDGTFFSCNKLSSLTTNAEEIGSRAFADCVQLNLYIKEFALYEEDSFDNILSLTTTE